MVNKVLNYSNFIQSQNMKNIFSHPDVQQKMLMMMGQSKDKKLELNPNEENQIAKNYSVMFFALATIHWCRGGTLGVARQKSLDYMDSFTKGKINIAHPMNKYLMAINNQIKREVSEINMKDENSDKQIGLSKTLKEKWIAEFTKMFQQNLTELKELYKKYTPEKDIKQQPATIQLKLARKRMEQKMLEMVASQNLNQRAA